MLKKSCTVMSLSALISMGILLSACGGGGSSSEGNNNAGGNPQPSLDIAKQRTISKDDLVFTVLPSLRENNVYTSYEIMTLNFPNIQPYYQLNVKVNGQIVEYSLEDQNLYILLPELGVGQHQVEVQVDDQRITHQFEIGQHMTAIANADQFLQDYFNELYLQLENPEEGSSLEDEAQRQEWLMLFSHVELALSEMTASNKQKLAQVLQANQYNEVQQAMQMRTFSALNDECSSLIWTTANIKPAVGAAMFGIGWMMLKGDPTTGIVLMVAGGAVLYKKKNQVVKLMADIIEHCEIGKTFRAFEQDFDAISNRRMTTSSFRVVSDVSLARNADILFTHNVADFRKAQLKLKLSDQVPDVLISSFQSILTGMKKIQTLLKNDYYSNIPKQIRQFGRYIDLDLNRQDFTVTTNHPNIVGDVMESSAGLNFKFTYKENNTAKKPENSPIPFSFTIVDRKDNVSFGSIDAKLNVELPNAYSQGFSLLNNNTLSQFLDAENFSSIQLIELPKHGKLSLNSVTGEFSYSPDAFKMVDDHFIYIAKNDFGESKPARVSIKIESDCRIIDTSLNRNSYNLNCYWPNTNIMRYTENLTLSPLSFNSAEKYTYGVDLNTSRGSGKTVQAATSSMSYQTNKEGTMSMSYIFDDGKVETISFDHSGNMSQRTCFYSNDQDTLLTIYRPAANPEAERINKIEGKNLCGQQSAVLVAQSTIKNSMLYKWVVQQGRIH
ncbi:hypothetical protein [Acinetobacter sp. NIPH 2699]|uniref:hypothetical protein n=1 Tax=Acinetobacter sp. NIPH 2699 TaxID=2923433 RepID=UPI001F4AC7E1|nr:hypothetical protein [Acinetobacter sp. NIPH 2699]MCH7336937.1 hypothetical protein [Acinetobacter sp. NIPH 2699]